MAATKHQFYTAYGEHMKTDCPTGNGIENLYGYEINKYGQKEIVKIGETNLYQKIQESLEETKIENILKRVAIGDTTVMRPDGIYADVSEAPKNLIEARQQIQALENTWNSLPIEIRQKYNMSVDEFIAKSGSESWMVDMGLITPKDPEPTKASKTKESEESAE